MKSNGLADATSSRVSVVQHEGHGGGPNGPHIPGCRVAVSLMFLLSFSLWLALMLQVAPLVKEWKERETERNVLVSKYGGK